MMNLKSKLSAALVALALAAPAAEAGVFCGEKCQKRKLQKNESKAMSFCNPDLTENQQSKKCQRAMRRFSKRGGDSGKLRNQMRREAMKADRFRRNRELQDARVQAQAARLQPAAAPADDHGF